MSQKIHRSWIEKNYSIVILVIWLSILLGCISYYWVRMVNSHKLWTDTSVASHPSLMSMHALSDSDIWRWKNNSPYTVVLYASMDCSHCKELELTMTGAIQELYRSKFSLAYRDAPLVDIEPLVAEKTLIGRCVYRQNGANAYFAFLHDMYEHYNTLQTNNDWVKVIALSHLKDKNEFNTCIHSDDVRWEVQKSRIESLADGVSSTPTIGIFQKWVLVARYSYGAKPTLKVLDYLAHFDQNADQFWSDALLQQWMQKI